MTAAAFRYGPMLEFEQLERHLGDTATDPATAAALDDAGEFPTAAVAALDDYGLHRHYVPVEHGGRLRDYETAVALVRAVAGRDVTAAIAHGKTFLGAVSVWVAGDDVQARRVADDVTSGRPVSWGLTEREHGSDLVGGDLTARSVPGCDGPGEAATAVRLDGEKWLINNATRGEVACVLARVDPEGGPRGFSLFLVDKARIDPATLTPLPKVRTAGIRGADISGFALDGTVVDGDTDRVGADGHGLEIVMKSLQLTRTLCSALSLGAGDHGLRLAVAFAEERRLYGRTLVDLPAAGRTLTECYADHLLAESLSLVATRSIQVLPGELSVISAAVKYLVPTRTEALLARLRRLLGARAWLRDIAATATDQDATAPVDGAGVFHKVERDHRIVALFDGNTVVNLNALISQFPVLGRVHTRPARAGAGDRLGTAADLSAPLPAPDHARLRLVPTAGISLLHGLDPAVAAYDELAAGAPALRPVAAAVTALRDRTRDLLAELAAAQVTPPDVPPAAFVLAHRLTLCLAGAAATQLWLHSRTAVVDAGGATAPLWQDGAWLLAALDRVLHDLTDGPFGTGCDADPSPLDTGAVDAAHARLLAVLREQVRTGRVTSLLPARLAGSDPAAREAGGATQGEPR